MSSAWRRITTVFTEPAPVDFDLENNRCRGLRCNTWLSVMHLIGVLRQVDLDSRSGRVRYAGSKTTVKVIFESSVSEDRIKASVDKVMEYKGMRTRWHEFDTMLVSEIDVPTRNGDMELNVLSVRTRNILKGCGIYTFDEIASYPEREIRELDGIGVIAMHEIEEQLSKHGKQFETC